MGLIYLEKSHLDIDKAKYYFEMSKQINPDFPMCKFYIIIITIINTF